MIHKIKDFLKDNTKTQATFVNSDYYYFFMKYEYNPETIVIYSTRKYKESSLSFDDKFGYEGFYSLITDEIYGMGFNIRDLCGLSWSDRIGLDSVKHKFLEELSDLIAKKVNDTIIPVEPESKVIFNKEDKENYLKQRVNDDALEKYYSHVLSSDITYSVDFNEDEYLLGTEVNLNMLANYINHPSSFIYEVADEWIKKYAGNINRDIWCDNELKAVLKKLETKDGPHTMRRAIADCITNQGCVNVTLEKKGQELTVQWNAASLKYDMIGRGCLREYGIKSPYQKLVEKMYEKRFADIKAEDIKQITYRKKVLYERKK